MQLNDLRPNRKARPERKRIGRGHGSGHVKTGGKGTKGQKARSGGSIRPQFEGGQLPIVQRLPYKRGFVNIFAQDWEIINLRDLNRFPAGTTVTRELLYGLRLVEHPDRPLKVLGDGKLEHPLTVRADAFSASARQAIEAAGGTVDLIPPKPRPVQTKRGKAAPAAG